jgi:hypothetical protein
MIDTVLATMTVSRIAAPFLFGILLTAVYGLNEMRLSAFAPAFDRHTLKEVCLSVSWMGLASSTGLMLWGILHGVEVITWRGLILISSFAGVLLFVGKFHPWRRWLTRTVPISRQWAGKAHPSSDDLSELIAECRRAIHYGAGECLRVLPKVISALEVLAAERLEMERIRAELIQTVGDLRRRFRNSESLSTDVVEHMDELLDRLQKALVDD